MSIGSIVSLVMLGLVVITVAILLIMYFLKKKKMRGGRLHSIIFNKSSAKVLNEEDEIKNSQILDSEAKMAP